VTAICFQTIIIIIIIIISSGGGGSGINISVSSSSSSSNGAGFTVVGDPGAIKVWRPLSVKTSLGYYKSSILFIFLIIAKNMNKLFVILEKQMSQ
jgi:hypothetical protein